MPKLFHCMLGLAFALAALPASAANPFALKSDGPGYLVVSPQAFASLYYDPATAEGPLEIVPSSGCGNLQGTCTWLVQGHIEGFETVSTAIATAQGLGRAPARISLNSAGGITGGAFALAGYILQNHIDTRVDEGSACLSSCVYVLTAGKQRSVDPYGLVGVHQARMRTNNSTIEEAQEDAASVSHRVDAAWLEIMLRAGVNPALLMYANTSRPYGTPNDITALSLPCLKALQLDNTQPAGATLDTISQQCQDTTMRFMFEPEKARSLQGLDAASRR